jgi:hypothetical protein
MAGRRWSQLLAPQSLSFRKSAMRISLAFKAFFAVLFSGAKAAQVKLALSGTPLASPPQLREPQPTVASPQPITPPAPKRSDAISLLATLQREARFVDLAQESLEAYSDEQVGAAARDVLRDCRSVLKRLFDLQPVVRAAEGAEIDVPAGFDAGQFRLTGRVEGPPPFRGRLMHHGWQAARCEIPQWSGSAEAARILAPAEVELP